MQHDPIRVLIVDDNAAMRAGIRSYLADREGIQVVAETGDPLQATTLLRETESNVVILDVMIPERNGIDIQKDITREFPAVRTVALSAYTDKRLVQAMVSAGADGYLSKVDAEEELETALRHVASGGSYFSEEIRRANPGKQ